MQRLIQFENWAEADTEASCLAGQRVHLTEQQVSVYLRLSPLHGWCGQKPTDTVTNTKTANRDLVAPN